MKNIFKNAIQKRRRGLCKRCAFTGYRPQKMPWGFDEMHPTCLEFKFRLQDEQMIESMRQLLESMNG